MTTEQQHVDTEVPGTCGHNNQETVDTKDLAGSEIPCDHNTPEAVSTEGIQDSKVKAEDLTWIQYDDSLEYAVSEEHDLLWIRLRNRIGHVTSSKKFPLSRVKKLFEKLPERSLSTDIVRVACDVGLEVGSLATALMKVFANYVAFDAELTTERGDGKHSRYVLVKNPDFSLREENRRKLQQELEVIGTFPGGD